MIPRAVAPLLAALILGAGERPAFADTLLSQSSIIVRERVVVRVPLPAAATTPPPLRQSRWKEKRGPRCLRLNTIAGAAIAGEDAVDLIFRGGARVRAQLESACPALDYYGGFYLRPGPDGRVCADRDAIHARSGGECGIERFRLLVPPRRH